MIDVTCLLNLCTLLTEGLKEARGCLIPSDSLDTAVFGTLNVDRAW